MPSQWLQRVPNPQRCGASLLAGLGDGVVVCSDLLEDKVSDVGVREVVPLLVVEVELLLVGVSGSGLGELITPGCAPDETMFSHVAREAPPSSDA